MAKLTKAEAKRHLEACEVLKKDVLTDDDKWFVLEHWQESANHVNSVAGAFFTPPALANDFSIEVAGMYGGKTRVIDLCAGIGGLSFMCHRRGRWNNEYPEVVCVELNPAYVEIGRKILPEATWVCASVFDLPDMGRFDYAISNPPFGSTGRNGARGPRYTGDKFEYHVIDVASQIADHGVFIIPQPSAGFVLSGAANFTERKDGAFNRFTEQTGIDLQPGCGIDCELYRGDWHGVSVSVEVVTCEFPSAAREEAAAEQADLFGNPISEAA